MPVTQFKTELNDQLATSQTAVTNATDLNPPKQLQPRTAVSAQALQYRVNGLRCLIKNANAAYAAKTQIGAGTPMAACTQKLLASDVIYADSFSGASTVILKADNTVAQPPTSRFLAPSDTGLVLPLGIRRGHPAPVQASHRPARHRGRADRGQAVRQGAERGRPDPGTRVLPTSPSR